jgi:23S rRNA (guanosine2251-2'-O)-methyltransferase
MALAGFGSRVEGAHAVQAAAVSGRVRKLWVEEGRLHRAEIQSIVELVGQQHISVVDDVRPMAETEAPQGLVAECAPISPVPIDEMTGPGAAIVVLDHIEDPQNVGAVARSAGAAGMTGLVMSSKRQAPLSATAFKAAAGALERIPVAIVGSIPEALTRLKDAGTWAVGLDASAPTPLFDLQILTEPVAVVVGAEGSGLSVLASKRCDVLASIPMRGGTESLNVSVSAALACFEIMRVRRAASVSPG